MGNIIRLTEENIKEVLSACLKALKSGAIVAYPTESFYALGAKYDDKKAINRIVRLKKRPAEKALPLIAGNLEAVMIVASSINDSSLRLARRYWPGPLTLLLPSRPNLPKWIVYEGKVAIRVPGESFALSLAVATGYPITATSANPSALPPALTADKVYEYFGTEIDLIVDGGKTKGGLPSTIIEATDKGIKIIREGAIKIYDEISLSLAIEMKNAFDAISPFIQSHTEAVCPNCTKVCCIDRHGTYETEDLVFLGALNCSPATLEPKVPDTSACRYLGTHGCILPRWKRPFRCTWYFCPELLEYMRRTGGRHYRRFIKDLEQLLLIRRKLLGIEPC